MNKRPTVLTFGCCIRVLDAGTEVTEDAEVSVSKGFDTFEGGDYTFVYRYPLSQPAEFKHTLPPQMGLEEFLVLAKEDYQRIYKEEDETTTVPAKNSQTVNIGGKTLELMNRTRTTGKHGIWGHVIGDLYFERVYVDIDNRIVHFDIGS